VTKYTDIFIISVALLFGIMMESNISRNDLQNQTSLYVQKFNSINGQTVDMSQFRGKVALVVNTATNCGFTSQYGDLEKLYRNYKDKNFVVLGFPSNDFAKQEPRSNEEIAEFCKVNFGVTFPLFEKAPVTGPDKQTSYKILTEKSAKELQGELGWNFVKFLIDKDGMPRARFSSITLPNSSLITSQIENLLEE